MIKVKEMMSRNLVTVESHQTVREAVSIMTGKSLGSVLVRKGNEIVGILEESDILKNVLAKDLNPYVATVEAVMSIPYVIDEEKTDNEASEMMVKMRVRRLLVSDGSAISGMVSMKDLLRPVYMGKSFWA